MDSLALLFFSEHMASFSFYLLVGIISLCSTMRESCSCWVTSAVTSNKKFDLFVVLKLRIRCFLVSTLQCEEKKKKH
jgi:hypothetical protein